MTMHSSLIIVPILFWALFFIFFNLNFPLALSSPIIACKSTNNITLFGDASITNNAISLTQPLSTCPQWHGLCDHLQCGRLQLLKRVYGSSPRSFFAVELDTSFDPLVDDINGSHVGVDVNTVESVASINLGIDLVSGREITAWVEYRDDLKLVRVWVGYSSENKPPSPILVAQIDLSKQFKELVHVGFCASNGKGSSAYIVDSWRFKTFNGPLPSVIPMDFWEEQDYFMCEDSSINITSVHVRKTRVVVDMVYGLVGLAAFALSVVACVFVTCCVCAKKREVNSRRNGKGPTCGLETSRVPTSLSLAEITSATMGFDRNRIVGEGATAKVYKGSLLSGGEVAVKGCLRHKNLVQLHGWCCEGDELVLVYEFMPNGSLNKILHRSFNLAVVLSWKQRLNIILGVASALAYLHEECERQIIHRDVKTCNIMLDADFNAKLGDFGLAEVYEHSSITREATIPAGTVGYLAPEYVYSGVPTAKTDVYSFGVVVLEVATGRKPVEDDGTVEMERMLITGLACVHPNHVKRPTVKEAARILQGEAPLPALPARKPRLSIRPVFHDDSEEIRNFCAGRFSLELDDVPFMTPNSQFGKD
ncbi:hypothetical protein M0R45_026967 [Rubus argutus]|uniref:Protein kinase domain-containing protein n=1 Tax=Rubus argutus TaxID=59490 RepID=A0AAW1X2H7_RUBAR